MHPSCSKMCNAEPLHIFVQLGCTFVQVSLSETCTHLLQATYVAHHDWGVDAHAHHPKKATTHSHYSATRPWPMPPPSSLGDKTIKICYKDDGDCRKGRASLSRCRRHWGRASASMCCRRHRPTDGGGPRSEVLKLAAGEETEASQRS